MNWKKKRRGRPIKYGLFLERLVDKEVYTPATVVLLGINQGLFHAGGGIFEVTPTRPQLLQARLRVRHTLARFAANHRFPMFGDGIVMLPGQAPLRGWFGWRWKEAMTIGQIGSPDKPISHRAEEHGPKAGDQ